MLCSWTWIGMLNVASVLKEACTKNCSTLLLHGWHLRGSHVICDCHLCGMRAKTEACSHSDTKVPSTRCGHFSHSLIGLCIYVFLRTAKTSRTNAFNRLGANTDLESFLSSKIPFLWAAYSICEYYFRVARLTEHATMLKLQTIHWLKFCLHWQHRKRSSFPIWTSQLISLTAPTISVPQPELKIWDLYFICYLFHFSVMPGC
jgi:hypothetical protein